MHKKYFVYHGHFYQPPRECPQHGIIEDQPSAAPFPNWNVRINTECYLANGQAPILNQDGSVLKKMNNYAWTNFNFGPTLLDWLRQYAYKTYDLILQGDKESLTRLGHGNAIAQVYNHMIMPLANSVDKKTQVLWGKADFQQHFGREPEGMHLAETAVNIEALEALAAEGIKYTILAPRQAKRWRRLAGKNWRSSGGIDPSRAYLCKLPSGRSIAIFFYDGPISQAVAFEQLLSSGERFLNRICSGFTDKRKHDQLVHVAVDGETAGHHWRFGEMCLAWLFNRLENDPDLQVINYGTFLEKHPPEWVVEIHENSSWSCAHGIERWRSDCGCKMRGDWHQRWRAPLREGLDNLREKLDDIFVTKGREYFLDPWSVRDKYIEVVLNASQSNSFAARHFLPCATGDKVQKGFELLEMQRYAMLMFTSCAWFFDDITGLEPTQNLRYAHRAIELAALFSDQDLESELLVHLSKAESNVTGDGATLWRRIIKPGCDRV